MLNNLTLSWECIDSWSRSPILILVILMLFIRTYVWIIIIFRLCWLYNLKSICLPLCWWSFVLFMWLFFFQNILMIIRIIRIISSYALYCNFWITCRNTPTHISIYFIFILQYVYQYHATDIKDENIDIFKHIQLEIPMNSYFSGLNPSITIFIDFILV